MVRCARSDGWSWGLARVRGISMQPTLADGDLLLVDRAAPIRPDALVLVRFSDRPVAVKRAVRREPEGWWVERDNPRSGVDSWSLGPVAEADVLGVVLARLWPRPSRLVPSR